MSTRTAVVALLLVFGALSGGAATAAPTVVDQYTEQLPSPGGEGYRPDNPPQPNQGGNPAGGKNGASNGASQDSPVATEPSSAAAAAPVAVEPAASEPAAAEPATEDRAGGSGSTGNGPGANDPRPGDGSGQNPPARLGADGATESSGPDSGMGMVFPLALIAALAGVVAMAAGRRRGSIQRRA